MESIPSTVATSRVSEDERRLGTIRCECFSIVYLLLNPPQNCAHRNLGGAAHMDITFAAQGTKV
jgi:hypothetical protein